MHRSCRADIGDRRKSVDRHQKIGFGEEAAQDVGGTCRAIQRESICVGSPNANCAGAQRQRLAVRVDPTC